MKHDHLGISLVYFAALGWTLEVRMEFATLFATLFGRLGVCRSLIDHPRPVGISP